MWIPSACGDATVPGIGGSRCFARRAHCPACDGPAGLVSERHLVVGTPEHHLDGWNRGPCGRCSGGCNATLSARWGSFPALLSLAPPGLCWLGPVQRKRMRLSFRNGWLALLCLSCCCDVGRRPLNSVGRSLVRPAKQGSWGLAIVPSSGNAVTKAIGVDGLCCFAYSEAQASPIAPSATCIAS